MFIQLSITHNKQLVNVFVGTRFGSKNSMWTWYNSVLRFYFLIYKNLRINLTFVFSSTFGQKF